MWWLFLHKRLFINKRLDNDNKAKSYWALYATT